MDGAVKHKAQIWGVGRCRSERVERSRDEITPEDVPRCKDKAGLDNPALPETRRRTLWFKVRQVGPTSQKLTMTRVASGVLTCDRPPATYISCPLPSLFLLPSSSSFQQIPPHFFPSHMPDMSAIANPQQRQFNPYTENGGTILAVAGADFTVIAGDTRQSEGYSIQTRYAPKVFRL